jgi:hypothetical protein
MVQKTVGLGVTVIDDWVRDAVTGAAPGIHPIPVRSDQVVGMQYSVSGFSPVTPGVPSGFSVAPVFSLMLVLSHSSGSEGSAVQRFCLPPANRCTTAIGANTVRDLATRPGRSPFCVRAAPVGLPRR